MPRKPAHPCNYPGCPKLTHERYCPDHQRQANQNYEKYHRNREAKRKYDSRWNRIRKAYAKAHPWCEECLKQGIYVPVEQVHHRKPLSEGGTHDWENLESLCTSCHSKIHAKRGDRFGQ